MPLAPLPVLHCAVLDAFVPVKRGQGSLKYGVAERWQLEVEEKRGRRRSVRVAGQLRLQEERADAEIFDGFDWVPNPSSPESRGCHGRPPHLQSSAGSRGGTASPTCSSGTARATLAMVSRTTRTAPMADSADSAAAAATAAATTTATTADTAAAALTMAATAASSTESA